MKKLLLIFSAILFVQSTSSVVTKELIQYDIYDSSFTITWKEKTTPLDHLETPSDIRYFRWIYNIIDGLIVFDREVEAEYTPGTSTRPIIDWGD